MHQLPDDLRNRGEEEMRQSFGFSEGIPEHFQAVVDLAVATHKHFLEALPEPDGAVAVPLKHFRGLSEKRRGQLKSTYARMQERLTENKTANNNFLLDQHKLRLGTMFAIDGRISTKTANELVEWIVSNDS